MFKRIYVEISNYCNLNCVFCSTKKNTRIMSLEQFKQVCDSIKGFTNEIVLHVLGEPLIHKDLIEMLNYASKYFKIMITTNGFLLNNYFRHDFINFSKMNISLHSSYILDEEKIINYLDTIVKFIEFSHSVNPNIIFNLRLWANTNDLVKKHNEIIINYLSKCYNLVYENKNVRLKQRVILTTDEEFVWPSLNNPFNTNNGSCKGGKTHIAILADGRVSICCLDSQCISDLGNIFSTSLLDIINSDKYKSVLKGFNDNKLVLDICKHCSYHNRKE